MQQEETKPSAFEKKGKGNWVLIKGKKKKNELAKARKAPRQLSLPLSSLTTGTG